MLAPLEACTEIDLIHRLLEQSKAIRNHHLFVCVATGDPLKQSLASRHIQLLHLGLQLVKTDFLLANSVGVIDPGYRGRIRVVLRYLGRAPDGGAAEARALLGTRMAQLLVRRLEPVQVEPVDGLDATARGSGGFGSSGD